MNNHIDHIEITNFKSIRHAKIEGCKRINVFIGYPNVGKSAILEAVSSLSYAQYTYQEPLASLCRIDGCSELFHDGNYQEDAFVRAGKVKVAFTYVTESIVDLFVLQLSLDSVTLDGGHVLLTDPNEWNIVKQLRFNGKNTNVSQLNLKQDIIKVKKYQFNGNNFNNYKTNGLSLFSPFGQNLVDIVQTNKSLRKEVSELFKSYDLKLSIDQGNNTIKALKQLDDDTIFLIPFYQMADTLQRLIFHKAAIMSNQGTVLLFEEPEAHMFPPYIRKFTGDLIFDKDNGNQYFISTHSPSVLEDLIADAKDDLSIFLVDLKNGETIIKRLSDDELNEVQEYGVDLFYNIQSYLD